MNPQEIAVYIHWPWCKKKCPYCDFNSHVADSIPEEDYLKALLTDFTTQARDHTHKKLVSIFFGGGTPSLMKAQTVETIINTVCQTFNTSPESIEITLEANPTSSDAQKFDTFKQAGVNRLSIGIQSLNDDDLRFLGREHTTAEALKTVNNAIKTFNNVNFDLIYGLPNQNIERWHAQLDTVAQMNVHHVSAYQLTIEPNTAFYSDVHKNKWAPLPSEEQADFFTLSRETLGKHGYEAYEISNHAKPGYQCKHNTHVWQYRDYLGIGAGAHGRLHIKGKTTQTQNYKLPMRYLSTVTEKQHGLFMSQEIDSTLEREEKLLMGLRLAEGIPLSEEEKSSLNNHWFYQLQKLGYIKEVNGKLTIPTKHTLLTDEILLKLTS